jgi:hypothetical protein
LPTLFVLDINDESALPQASYPASTRIRLSG